MMRKAAALVALLAVSNVASAVVVSFEDVTPENGLVDVVSFGYNFKSGFAGWLYSPPGGNIETGFSGNPHDSMRLAGSGDSGGGSKVDLPGPGVRMTEVGGGAFSVFGFEAATFSTSQLTDVLTIEAEFSGGGTISTTVDLTTSFQTFLLSGFEDVTRVDFWSTVAGGFPNDGFQIDDISTEPVASAPEPATTALLALGLLGVGYATRRRGR